MKKNLSAFALVIVLLAAVVLVGEWVRRGRVPDDETMTETRIETQTETQTALPAAATTQATEPQIETTAAETQTEATTAGSRGTYTNRFPLPTIRYTVTDPDNTRGLSTKRIDHGRPCGRCTPPCRVPLSG